MFLRMNDVLVGVIAGAVCSVLAAGFEAIIVTLRLLFRRATSVAESAVSSC